MKTRLIHSGEHLAIEPGAIMRGADGFFLMYGSETPDNHRHAKYDDVAIVYARGSLEHHVTPEADSYECILDKIDRAFQGLDACEEGEQPTPPSVVVLCIDSRGGVVSGLNETVFAIQRLRKRYGIPLVAHINEMAASAAYALACSCDEIVCPPSAILGSIGTISTMMSCYEQDKAMGLDVRLITSGARKADGHPHAPITDAAEGAERERVEQLAEQFFELASDARKIPVKTLRAMQAAILLGPQAVKRGLADSIACLDDVARLYSKVSSPAAQPKAKGNETDRRAGSRA